MRRLESYQQLNENITGKIINRFSMYIKRKFYILTALIHPIKSMKNVYVSVLNSIEDLVTNEKIKERFYIDYQSLIRKVLVGEIKSAKDFSRDYNNILKKYGYREYSILEFKDQEKSYDEEVESEARAEVDNLDKESIRKALEEK